jgi:steroid 5-alpha reductase family enzyme
VALLPQSKPAHPQVRVVYRHHALRQYRYGGVYAVDFSPATGECASSRCLGSPQRDIDGNGVSGMSGLPCFEAYSIALAISLLIAVTSLYGISRLIKNAGIVDIFWAASFGAITITLYGLSLQSGHAFSVTSASLWFTGMVGLSSVRLTWHIAQRFAHEYPVEDARYTGLRNNWPAHPEIYMWLIFLFQAALITLLSAPFYAVFEMPNTPLSLLSILALALWGIGVITETLADWQLSRFKKRPKSDSHPHKAILDTGLWARSRHPNYFGQWLTWVAFSAFILSTSSSPLAYFSVLQPLIMYFMLTRMSGVPITEEHMTRTRGEAFLAYQERTPVFFPKLF